MKYSSRFFLYAPLAVVLALFALAGGHWWSMAAALSARLEANNGREIMPGVLFHYRTKRISGFPFGLDTELSDFTLAMGTATGTTVWRSEKFAMHSLTYGRTETIFEAAGQQSLQWGGKHLDFAVGALRASAIIDQSALTRLDVDLVAFGSQAFTAQRLQLHARRRGERGEIETQVTGLTVPGCTVPANFAYSAYVTNASALLPLLAGQRYWDDGIAAWRRKGGLVGSRGASPLSQIPLEKLPGIAALASAICPY